MARTLITNTSGGEKHFGFLPPHGVDLEDGEEHVVDGDLRTILAGGRGRYSRSREIAALDAAVDGGEITSEDHPDPSSSSSSA
jgi:hypothetical protein